MILTILKPDIVKRNVSVIGDGNLTPNHPIIQIRRCGVSERQEIPSNMYILKASLINLEAYLIYTHTQ